MKGGDKMTALENYIKRHNEEVGSKNNVQVEVVEEKPKRGRNSKPKKEVIEEVKEVETTEETTSEETTEETTSEETTEE